MTAFQIASARRISDVTCSGHGETRVSCTSCLERVQPSLSNVSSAQNCDNIVILLACGTWCCEPLENPPDAGSPTGTCGSFPPSSTNASCQSLTAPGIDKLCAISRPARSMRGVAVQSRACYEVCRTAGDLRSLHPTSSHLSEIQHPRSEDAPPKRRRRDM